jgi:hypothetical protein
VGRPSVRILFIIWLFSLGMLDGLMNTCVFGTSTSYTEVSKFALKITPLYARVLFTNSMSSLTTTSDGTNGRIRPILPPTSVGGHK